MIPYDALVNNFRTDFFPTSPLCAEIGGDLFFPETKKEVRQIAQAKAYCFMCVEQKACRTYALKADERDGIWGGLDEDERRLIRHNDKERVRSAHAEGWSDDLISQEYDLDLDYVQKLIEEISRVPRGWMLNRQEAK